MSRRSSILMISATHTGTVHPGIHGVTVHGDTDGATARGIMEVSAEVITDGMIRGTTDSGMPVIMTRSSMTHGSDTGTRGITTISTTDGMTHTHLITTTPLQGTRTFTVVQGKASDSHRQALPDSTVVGLRQGFRGAQARQGANRQEGHRPPLLPPVRQLRPTTAGQAKAQPHPAVRQFQGAAHQPRLQA